MLVKAASVPRYTLCWYECQPASCHGFTKVEFSNWLALAKTQSEVQLLLKVNVLHKLLNKLQEKEYQTRTPRSNSTWEATQWLDSEQKVNRSDVTYCQSFCTALLGSSAQSDRPLSSWLQIHFGFCLQSSPPSRWCSRYSLVGRFAGAPLKWEKTQVNGQLWKGKDFNPAELSIKTFQLPGNLELLTCLPASLSYPLLL